MKRLVVMLFVVFGLVFGSFGFASAMGGGGKHSKRHKITKTSEVNQDNEQSTGEDMIPSRDFSNLPQNRVQAPLPVPEPGTLILLGLGLAGLVLYKRKK